MATTSSFPANLKIWNIFLPTLPICLSGLERTSTTGSTLKSKGLLKDDKVFQFGVDPIEKFQMVV